MLPGGVRGCAEATRGRYGLLEVEDRALAELRVLLRLGAPGLRLGKHSQHPAPRRSGRVERPATHE